MDIREAYIWTLFGKYFVNIWRIIGEYLVNALLIRVKSVKSTNIWLVFANASQMLRESLGEYKIFGIWQIISWTFTKYSRSIREYYLQSL